jgi:sialic acid synthase SpsE
MWDSTDLYSLYKKAHTPWDWHAPLLAKARACGLHLFSSPFDETAVDFLVDLGVPALKIASFEVVDTKLLQRVAATGLPVLMSSGMTNYLELVEAVTALRQSGCGQLGLFHCNSGYPASFEEANLKTIPALKRLFDVPVGLSDHMIFADPDRLTTPLAHISPMEGVRHGADFVEVHLTLDRARARELNQDGAGGFDWAFSRNPVEFKTMVKMIRDFENGRRVEYETQLERVCAEQCSGKVVLEPTERELSSRRLRPSLWVIRSIVKGERFRFAAGGQVGNVDSIRPGEGLHVRFTDLVCESKATRDLAAGTPLAWEHVSLGEHLTDGK